MTQAFPPLALTMGEPGGIGPEITIGAWRQLRETGPAFFLIGAPSLYADMAVPVTEIATPAEATAAFKDALPILPLQSQVMATPGAAKPQTANAVIESIERATALTLSGEARAVVTNPIQKSALIAGGFEFPGHTEFLDALTQSAPMPNDRTRGAVMMLAGDVLRTVPVTIHVSVKDAAAALTPDLIIRTAIITAEALRDDFGIAEPRLAISALNPHAGEKGAMGFEDELVIAPAIDALKEDGLNAWGPAPADTLFHKEARTAYDAALCMLHDQALIPVKTISFHDAVNVTLGLPIIRTSPDHGTALDIAGKGLALSDSLIAALHLADTLSQKRAQGTAP